MGLISRIHKVINCHLIDIHVPVIHFTLVTGVMRNLLEWVMCVREGPKADERFFRDGRK